MMSKTMDSDNCVTLAKDPVAGWTLPRSAVPELLAGAGVSLHLWQETWDGAVKHQDAIHSLLQQFHDNSHNKNVEPYVAVLLIIVFFLICLPNLSTMMSSTLFILWAVLGVVVVIAVAMIVHDRKKEKQRKGHLLRKIRARGRAWQAFVHKKQPQFYAHGVKAIMITWKKANARREKPKLIVGGIKFVVTQQNNSTENLASSRDMVKDLEALQRLKESGALTEEEFSQAKSKVWRDYGIGGMAAQPALVQRDVVAQPTPSGNLVAGPDEVPAMAFVEIVPVSGEDDVLGGGLDEYECVECFQKGEEQDDDEEDTGLLELV